jgi:hypothetical protein
VRLPTTGHVPSLAPPGAGHEERIALYATVGRQRTLRALIREPLASCASTGAQGEGCPVSPTVVMPMVERLERLPSAFFLGHRPEDLHGLKNRDHRREAQPV